ncbi:GntR family transcriptional regulator [Roseateles cellulosilyticus]|uniref:GntR family transcriptional regulator n=1 Tax=Pelomonas cellulosilytica TaxID=2906762 RepID=A0ABS8XKL4_9BURK|nr:GntR family transcriptional regulator [Pelomonas sp. P8]MCE4553382.1 GntR family transcriptional regulator [Pelomonas sp. P8]
MSKTAAPAPALRTALTRQNATSLYEQIAARLMEEMEAGLYEPTGRLPSEAEIGERFGVSRVTVRLALDKLVQEGAVVRKQGKGSFVAGRQMRHGLDTLRSFHESLKLQGLRATMQLLEKKVVTLPDDMRQRFAPAVRGLFVQRLHFVDGEPIALGESHLPYRLNDLSWAEVEQQPAYSLLADKMGEGPARADIAIGALAADERLAGALQVAAGSALLLMRRTSYFGSGACCDHTHFYIRPERYEFVMSSTFRPA